MQDSMLKHWKQRIVIRFPVEARSVKLYDTLQQKLLVKDIPNISSDWTPKTTKAVTIMLDLNRGQGHEWGLTPRQTGVRKAS
jgi:hypothetical protein